MTARERQGSLDGLRVVDFSGISGGFATSPLGDFGASVMVDEIAESVEHVTRTRGRN